uniref:FBD domain-containing protein n=1 Tax=Steinernema glaseri TaxID=37863 RepID=A0A1I7YRD5_9BILA
MSEKEQTKSQAKRLKAVARRLGRRLSRFVYFVTKGEFGYDEERERAKLEALFAQRRQEKFLSRGAAMAWVPFAFIESVCATLGSSSRWQLMCMNDGNPGHCDGPWSTTARDIKVKFFHQCVLFQGRDEVRYDQEHFHYNDQGNSEDLRNAKYAICRNLMLTRNNLRSLSLYGRPAKLDKKGDLTTLLTRSQIEKLHIMSAYYLDNYLAYISPWYLKSVEISHCKFKSASPLSCWLKKVLANKYLYEFEVSYNSVEEAVTEKDDFEEDVLRLLTRALKKVEDCMYLVELPVFHIRRNDSIADLRVSFLRNYLDQWTGYRAESIRGRILVH